MSAVGGALERPGDRKHRWLNEHIHIAIFVVFSLGAFGAYLYFHHWKQSDYLTDMTPMIEQSVKSYGLYKDPRTGFLELRVGDEAYVENEAEAGPLGIGKLAPARGLLSSTAATLKRYRDSLQSYVDHLTGAFVLNTMNSNTGLAPLSVIAPKHHASMPQDSNVAYRLSVDARQLASVKARSPDENSAALAISLIRGATIVDLLGDSTPRQCNVNDRRPQCISARAAALEVCRDINDLRVDVRNLLAPTRVGKLGCAEGADEVDCLCTFERSWIPSFDERNSQFHTDLKRIVKENAGFFWTMGPYLWCEILMLAALGVITNRLIFFSRVYAGRHDVSSAKIVWQPRETVRALIYLIYTPILAAIIIWILKLTNLLTIEPVLGDVWSHAVVPVAFLLGLFPDVGERVLRGVVEGIFGPIIDKKPRVARPTTIPGSSKDGAHSSPEMGQGGTSPSSDGEGTDDGRAPSFDDFRTKVRIYASAIFQ